MSHDEKDCVNCNDKPVPMTSSACEAAFGDRSGEAWDPDVGARVWYLGMGPTIIGTVEERTRTGAMVKWPRGSSKWYGLDEIRPEIESKDRPSDDQAEPESPNFVPQSAKDLAARNFERVNLRAETARDPYTAEEWADARIRARACETESPSFRDDLVTAFKAGRASAATAEKREPIEAMVERFFNENPGCEGYQHVINQLVTDVTVDWFEYGWKCAEEHAEWQRRPTATAAASVAKSPTRERCGAFTPVTLYCDRPEDHDGDHRFVETFTGNERLVHRRERDQPQQGAMDLSEALDLLEELASSDYDMPSHNDTMDRVDVFLAKHGRTA